jgi:4-diphosphocytidyl-2-C-methyl-D-erythritol kinase
MPAEIARAKINLTLHVGGAIEDPENRFHGYHPLDSLVVFADIADTVSCEPADETTLKIVGEFGDQLTAGENNLILKAYRAVTARTQCPALAFSLDKTLPVAAGIGGGSANAAATLRLLKHYADLPGQDWEEIALGLGADVLACLRSTTLRMQGIGEDITRLSDMGIVHAVFVNPGVQVMTGDVFNAFDSGCPDKTPRPQTEAKDLQAMALGGHNDLEPVTAALSPAIGEVLTHLGQQDGCYLARMSGSGATCFGLFETASVAQKAATKLGGSKPNWWVKPAVLGDL